MAIHSSFKRPSSSFSVRSAEGQAIQLEVTLESGAAFAFSLFLRVKPGGGGLSPTQNSTENR